MLRHSSALFVPLAAVLLSSGCMIVSDFGITPGGSQDIELAREIITSGGVPRADQFTAEGLFSQHDLDTPELDGCAELLCPRASLARIDPVDGSGEQVLVHLGFATNIEQFERADLNVAAVVDISGSMGGEKLDSTKLALHTLVDQLSESDRISLVSFGSEARVEAPSTIMDASGRASLHAQIDELDIEGSTNIEEGLLSGYQSIDAHRDGPGGREDRVMLFTDAQPNVGATDPDSFVGMAKARAAEGVGISVFGVGADLGAELARKVSEVRGGNSFYLADGEAIATVFDEELDYIVTPVAYSLHFQVTPASGFSFVGAYGTPDADASDEVDVSLATAFLSARSGAMAVLLDGDLDEVQPGATVVSFTLEYESVEGELGNGSFEAQWVGGDFPIGESGEADHSGGAKLAVLLDEFLALEGGAMYCADQLTQGDALERIDAAAERLEDMAKLLDDEPLREEAELMRKLSANVAAGSC